MKNVIVSWSGGKDSAFAVYNLINECDYQIMGLLSTTSEASGRLPMHEVKREFIQAQAASLGIPLYEVKLPARAGNTTYEEKHSRQFDRFKNEGIHMIAYADLFLEDIRSYRDKLLSKSEMRGLYPLWGKDTKDVARDFIDQGFKAIITAVDTDKLPAEMAGRYFDEAFLRDLPNDVDPCGEYGEFHTFVFDGPVFNFSINVKPEKLFETMEGRFSHVELIEE
ncbi:diphthine--ammonia ligase [Virgibacillus sp. C22-A2]|uniref:Diphthine--ammonia ligase n=1 Tax=Virgibacillus tibetensis TaxID=3042313 RepID=A0ABU6KMG6_9BACI|nr:diphthine--ammonia ligase [Virgibacillus sp. C22-A2]